MASRRIIAITYSSRTASCMTRAGEPTPSAFRIRMESKSMMAHVMSGCSTMRRPVVSAGSKSRHMRHRPLLRLLKSSGTSQSMTIVRSISAISVTIKQQTRRHKLPITSSRHGLSHRRLNIHRFMQTQNRGHSSSRHIGTSSFMTSPSSVTRTMITRNSR